MENATLREYPILYSDPEMDFEFSREMRGRGFATYSIEELKLNSGKTLVYMVNLREGDELVDTPLGFKRKCVEGRTICGFKYQISKKGFFRKHKEDKIEIIPENRKQQIKSELARKSNISEESIGFLY